MKKLSPANMIISNDIGNLPNETIPNDVGNLPNETVWNGIY